MAFDKNGQELFDYTYAIAKIAVSEGRDELVFLYKDMEYYICVSNKTLVKKFSKAQRSSHLYYENSCSSYWCCCTKKGDVLVIAPKEKIMDLITIDGKHLVDIWSEIVLL